MTVPLKKILSLIGVATLALSCSQGSLSERDARLEQLRFQAEAKRRELQKVVGEYSGKSEQSTGASHDIFLRLEIKDIPTPVEGQPEPVMMPALSGFLRFYLGSGPMEYIVFAIDKAGFDVAQNKIEFSSSNSEYKELIASLTRTESELKGTWSAPSMAASGTFSLTRNQNN